MAEGKNSFLMYRDYLEEFESLSDSELGIAMRWVLKYVNDLDPELPEDRVVRLICTRIKRDLKRDLVKWESKSKSKSDGGKIGNLKRWYPEIYKEFQMNKISLEEAIVKAQNRSHTDHTRSDGIAKIAVSVNDSVSVSVNDSVKEAIVWSDEEKEFIDKLSNNHREFWFVKEADNPRLYMDVWRWISGLEKRQIIYLSTQLEFYKKIIGETGRIKCTLPNWMKEKWNETNYSDTYGQSVNRMGPKGKEDLKTKNAQYYVQ